MQLASCLAVCCPPTLPPLSHRTDTSYASSVWDTAVPTLIIWPNNRLVGLNKTTYVHCFITVLCLESKYTHKLTPIMGSSLQIGDYKLCRFSLIFVYCVGYSFISMPNCGQIWGCSCESRGTVFYFHINHQLWVHNESSRWRHLLCVLVYGCKVCTWRYQSISSHSSQWRIDSLL